MAKSFRSTPGVPVSSKTDPMVEVVEDSSPVDDEVRYLPAEGYAEKPPRFPLPVAIGFENEELRDYFRKRELAIWRDWWKSPQAHAWIEEPWRWHTIALAARHFVSCEISAKAADRALLHRFLSDIGLTSAGLKTNGWRILPQEEIDAILNPPPAVVQEVLPIVETPPVRERRLRAVK